MIQVLYLYIKRESFEIDSEKKLQIKYFDIWETLQNNMEGASGWVIDKTRFDMNWSVFLMSKLVRCAEEFIILFALALSVLKVSVMDT